MAEGNLKHELPLRRILKPKGGESDRFQFSCIEKPNNLSAIHGIASQAIRMPRQNAPGVAVLYARQHRIENWPPRFFGGLLLDVHFFDLDMLSSCELFQFCNLIINAADLPIFGIRRFASIENECVGLNTHTFSRILSQNEFKRLVCAKRSAVTTASNFRLAGGTLTFSPHGAWQLLVNQRETPSSHAGAHGVVAVETADRSSWRSLLNEIRTYFQHNPDVDT